MELWKTNLNKFRHLAEIPIKCGIDQGDALSPWLLSTEPSDPGPYQVWPTDIDHEMEQQSHTSSTWIELYAQSETETCQ